MKRSFGSSPKQERQQRPLRVNQSDSTEIYPDAENWTSADVSPDTLLYLLPFIGQECSLAEAAEQLQVATSTMQYRIQTFLESGVLKLSSIKRRPGRPVKYYRSSRDTLFISFQTSASNTLEDFVKSWHQPWNEYFLQNVCKTLDQQHPDWGIRVYRKPNGELVILPAYNPHSDYDPLSEDEPALLLGWHPKLYLEPDEAKNLQRELSELLHRYEQKGGSQRYILRLALSPVQEDSSLLLSTK
jgi:hypothetical protein